MSDNSKDIQLNQEDVVISGLSGRFPNCDNVDELKEALFNHVDLVTADERRWPTGYSGLLPRMGKIKDLTKFDARFFGFVPKLANHADPQVRILLELTHEAIVDAGINPLTLRGSRTGVFIGTCFGEVEDGLLQSLDTLKNVSLISTARSMLANRISFHFDFHGPSYVLDSACSSSLAALHSALLSIHTNQCDQAVVGGANLCLRPATSIQFLSMKVHAPDGKCKHLDAQADGYVRSETCAVVFLQRKSIAKRIYATVIQARTNTDGHKDGITFPSWSSQRDLMAETLLEAGLQPADIEYVEAHGTGTPAGDPVETKAIAEVYCKPARAQPLLIGSVKSNMGHGEGAAGLNSLAKAILIFENGQIPANLHYESPNPNIPELIAGLVKPVVCNTPFNGGIVAVNSFGIGGANVNVLLKPFTKQASTDQQSNGHNCAIPRIVSVAGPTEEAVQFILDFIVTNPQKANSEFLALLQEVSWADLNFMNFRGYLLMDQVNTKTEIQQAPSAANRRPLWFVYSGMGSQWCSMAKGMMEIVVFRDSLDKLTQILKPYNIDLMDLVLGENEDVLENTIGPFVAITAVQIALTDVLNSVGLVPDGILGHSLGEIACGYADGVLTREQAILTSYWRGKCVQDAAVPRGLMAAVGLSWEEALNRCPAGIVPACHNAEDSVTISGPYESMVKFIEQLDEEAIFARVVKTGEVGYHCYYMDPVAVDLMVKMKQVIPERSLRSNKWICSSFPESQCNSEPARYSSPFYYVNNLTSPVRFYDACKQVPKNAIVLEIAPHSLMQSTIKRNLGSGIIYLNLMSRNQNEHNVRTTLETLGKLYNLGLNPNLASLYPKVQFPVSRGTQSLSSLIRWDHSESWLVTLYPEFFNPFKSYSVTIDLHDPEYAFYAGHCVDGRVIFPATGYLFLVWQMLAKFKGKNSLSELPVQFENIELHRATSFQAKSTKQKVTFDIEYIEKNGGEFCVSTAGATVITGKAWIPQQSPCILQHVLDKTPKAQNDQIILNADDIYKEFRVRGYDYGESFRGIQQSNIDTRTSRIKYTNWVVFLDSMLQLSILDQQTRRLYLPVRIQSVRFDAKSFHEGCHIHSANHEDPILEAKTDPEIGAIVARGIEVQGINGGMVARRRQEVPVLEQYSFVPYFGSNCIEDCELEFELSNYMEVITALACKVAQAHKLKLIYSNKNQVEGQSNFKISNEPKHQLAQLLYALSQEKCHRKCIQMIADCALDRDLLNIECESQPFLRNIIEIVIENLNATSTLNMVELNTAATVSPFNNITNKINDYADQAGSRINLKYQFYSLVSNNSCRELPFVAGSMDFLLLKIEHSTIIGECFIDYPKFVQSARNILKNYGFLAVLLRTQISLGEQVLCQIKGTKINNNLDHLETFKKQCKKRGLRLISERTDSITNTTALLFRKISLETPENYSQIEIHNTDYSSWVEVLKHQLNEIQVNLEKNKKIWLNANGTPNGIVGLVRSLRLEPGGDRIRCVYNTTPSESALNSMTLKKLIANDLVQNVIQNGTIGSYRNFELSPHQCECLVKTEHAFLNTSVRGDLSSFRWYKAPHSKHFVQSAEHTLCSVYYAALNFRDVMLATGKLSLDSLPEQLAIQDCVLGYEFSGRRSSDGTRVMGIVPSKGLATSLVVNDAEFLWNVPDDWNLYEAATVPVVYATAYYALFARGKVQPGEWVLVHSGSGGVGQAAIRLCLSMGCRIITTVGSEQKKAFLQRIFPSLLDDCFANSRDTTFEEHVMRQTGGRGVDIVLNSLSEEKLYASVRCLAPHGRFLEIGKYDLWQNSPLGMSAFLNSIEYHGVFLDTFFESTDKLTERVTKQKSIVARLLQDGINSGVVQPLARTIFDKTKCEDAFRFMASGKHIGKVLLKICDEEIGLKSQLPINQVTVRAISRTTFSPAKSYIIIGGLGGFGLELSAWLVEHGARKIVLTTRSVAQDAFQRMSLKRLSEQSVQVLVSNADVSNLDEASQLLQEAAKLGPIGGVFNLALVLSDAFMANQTVQSFETVCAVKVHGTMNLDTLTRTKDFGHSMDYFVVFSSLASRGNAGQANYAFANCSAEQICEARHADGLHGLAIQWGAVGDVGNLFKKFEHMNNDTVMLGTLPQRIHSCLSVLDRYLHLPGATYSSNVPARGAQAALAQNQDQNLLERIGNIFGVKNFESLSPGVTLVELGMDSLIAVEVKQILEQHLESVHSMQEIRLLSVAKSIELCGGAGGGCDAKSQNKNTLSKVVPTQIVHSQIAPVQQQTFVQLNCPNSNCAHSVLLLPPIEGTFDLLQPVVNLFQSTAIFGLNWSKELNNFTSIDRISDYYIEQLSTLKLGGVYNLVAYSFGTIIAFDMAIKLQSKEHTKKVNLILLDYAPTRFATDYNRYHMELTKFAAADDLAKFPEIFCQFLDYMAPGLDRCNIKQFAATIGLKQKFEETKHDDDDLSSDSIEISNDTNIFVKKIAMVFNYQVGSKMFAGNAVLIRASENAHVQAHDYDFSKIITQKCQVNILPGNHQSFIANNAQQIASLIKEQINNE